jgi:predicted nicotinamide N-methyase
MSADGVVVSVRIPHGAEPGDLLSLEVNGQNFTIEVPVASVMGEILEIKLAGCADEEDIAVDGSGVGVEKNVDPEKINFTMVTGSSIRIFQDSQTKTSEKTVSDGTFRLLWPASRFVVNYINTPDFRRDILSSQVHSALELGAGHGLLGLAFSDVASSVSSANETMKLKLTDVEEALPQLERNIRINRDVFEKRVDIAASPLKWHIQPRPRTNSNYDFILGSDLLYNTSVIPDLVATIRQLKFKRILFSVRVSAHLLSIQSPVCCSLLTLNMQYIFVALKVEKAIRRKKILRTAKRYR